MSTIPIVDWHTSNEKPKHDGIYWLFEPNDSVIGGYVFIAGYSQGKFRNILRQLEVGYSHWAEMVMPQAPKVAP